MDISEKIRKLSAELHRANEVYYREHRSLMSDFEFDQKLKELDALESEYPDLASLESPTKRVGVDLSSDFIKVSHQYPMLSISNVYGPDEARSFLNDLQKTFATLPKIVVEPKIDGTSLAVVYIDRKFCYAVTRGDGKQGDDVSKNARTILDIPLVLSNLAPMGRIEVRGEVYMLHQDFELFNQRLVEQGAVPMQNPRNCASGTLKLKDSREVARRRLHFFAYQLYCDSVSLVRHSSSLEMLANWGFVVNHWRVFDEVSPIIDFCLQYEEQRSELMFDIDGMVLKVDELALRDELGTTSKSPRWAVAYKFTAVQAESIVESIEIQVGRTGVITPVANLSPVQLCGTIVRRATLHNFEEIARLNLRIGDTVLVEKGGEIIPKIRSVILDKREFDSQEFKLPTHCPSCGHELVQQSGVVALKCENLQCPAQIQRLFEHFVSRSSMNIESVGPALIEQLLQKNCLSRLSDLYRLSLDQLILLDRMADKSAQNVLDSLELSKKNSSDRLLHGLGIPLVGRTIAQNLMRHFSSLRILSLASSDELCQIDGVSLKIAESIRTFFESEQNRILLDEFEDLGLSLLGLLGAKEGPLKGKVFVLTGTLPNLDRETARKMLEGAGAKISSSVSKKTDFVLAGHDAGSKLEKALALGVRVLTDDDLAVMLQMDSLS